MPSNLPIDGHSFRRVEVLTGTPRRRRWNMAEKAATVAESLAPGAVTSEIALRYGLHRNQLYGWRREFRRREPHRVRRGGDRPEQKRTPERRCRRAPLHEIEICGAIVRVGAGVDPAVLGEVIRLLKVMA